MEEYEIERLTELYEEERDKITRVDVGDLTNEEGTVVDDESTGIDVNADTSLLIIGLCSGIFFITLIIAISLYMYLRK